MPALQERRRLGRTGLHVPPVVFGTSCLGNLYEALPWATKRGIVQEWFRHMDAPVALDSAGKYGAGLALESIGRALRELGLRPQDVTICNKLCWRRAPLRGTEPTFEPGVWKGLEHDAVQDVGYEGLLRCWEEGCELLGDYRPRIASLHDPDEYLAQARTKAERADRWSRILDAYRALGELKRRGAVEAVGVGAKDWTVIRELAEAVELDWAMLACSFTIYRHPREVVDFIAALDARGIGIVNSAVFHAGFLVGGRHFDYRVASRENPQDAGLFAWRDRFLALCRSFEVVPAAACVQFATSAPGIVSIALNTSRPERVRENVALVTRRVPEAFWSAMKERGLIAADYPYVGSSVQADTVGAPSAAVGRPVRAGPLDFAASRSPDDR